MTQKAYRGRPTCTVVYCKICNKVVDKSIRNQKQTCSIDCEVELKRTTSRLMYARKMERDPDYCKKKNARRQFKVDTSPELRQQYLERERIRYKKRKNDPAYKEIKKRAKQRYALRHKDRIDSYRKRYREAIGEQAYYLQRMQADLNRLEKRKELLEELKKDPVAYEKYRAERREYERNRKAEKRLADLQKDMSKMVNKDE